MFPKLELRYNAERPNQDAQFSSIWDELWDNLEGSDPNMSERMGRNTIHLLLRLQLQNTKLFVCHLGWKLSAAIMMRSLTSM